jgi:hypothetical protein
VGRMLWGMAKRANAERSLRGSSMISYTVDRGVVDGRQGVKKRGGFGGRGEDNRAVL